MSSKLNSEGQVEVMSEGSIIQAVKAGNIKVLKKASKKDLLKAELSLIHI